MRIDECRQARDVKRIGNIRHSNFLDPFERSVDENALIGVDSGDLRDALLQRDPAANIHFVRSVRLVALAVCDGETLLQSTLDRTRQIGTQNVVCGACNEGQRHGV